MKVYSKIPMGLVFQTSAGRSVVINGQNHKSQVAGYGVTSVNNDLWNSLAETYKAHPAFVNRLVFATTNDADADSKIKELKNEKSGMERIDPLNPGCKIKTGVKDRIEPVNEKNSTRRGNI